MDESESGAFEVKYLDGEEEECAWIKRAGEASVKYPCGDTYVGWFNDEGKRDGRGEYSWVKAPTEEDDDDEEKVVATYKGAYVSGKRCGSGRFTAPDGSIYDGIWDNGLKSGQGSLVYASKDAYSGEWRNNLRHGKGMYLFKATGSRLNGVWEEGEVKNGTIFHADGSRFEGIFEKNLPTEGTLCDER